MDYLTKQEAAERLKLSTKTIQKWVASGKLKSVRLGYNVLRIPASSVEKLLRGK